MPDSISNLANAYALTAEETALQLGVETAKGLNAAEAQLRRSSACSGMAQIN